MGCVWQGRPLLALLQSGYKQPGRPSLTLLRGRQVLEAAVPGLLQRLEAMEGVVEEVSVLRHWQEGHLGLHRMEQVGARLSCSCGRFGEGGRVWRC